MLLYLSKAKIQIGTYKIDQTHTVKFISTNNVSIYFIYHVSFLQNSILPDNPVNPLRKQSSPNDRFA